MNREAEAPAQNKLTHDQVGYENHSSHLGQTCSNCSMFIEALVPRCTLVLRPIHRQGWCRRWQAKHNNQWP